tara:strand:- start:433 stop:594 length:162 start_codon:yes stop_codon:yes gene_type:complete
MKLLLILASTIFGFMLCAYLTAAEIVPVGNANPTGVIGLAMVAIGISMAASDD